MTRDSTTTARLTHKRSIQNTWIEHVRSTARSQEFEFTARGDTERTRITDLIEIERQAGMFFIHTALGVPLSDVFVLSSISVEKSVARLPLTEDKSRQRIEVQASRVRMSGAEVREAALVFNLNFSGFNATGHATGKFVPQQIYARLRQASQRSAFTEQIRHSPQDAVQMISIPLELDWGDPVLRDHPSDHVPGMGVILAIDQAVENALTDQSILSLDVRYLAYMPLSPPPHLTLSVTEDDSLKGTVAHGGRLGALVHGMLMRNETAETE